MTPERIQLYKLQLLLASSGFTDDRKAKIFNMSIAHKQQRVIPRVSFTKDILRFVRAPDYYANKEKSKQSMFDELDWLVANGYFKLVLVDGPRVKGQLCYAATDKLSEV